MFFGKDRGVSIFTFFETEKTDAIAQDRVTLEPPPEVFLAPCCTGGGGGGVTSGSCQRIEIGL